jgi:hypothetical protein
LLGIGKLIDRHFHGTVALRNIVGGSGFPAAINPSPLNKSRPESRSPVAILKIAADSNN